MDYLSSGVDIEKGGRIAEWLKNKTPPRRCDRILSGIGGFASLLKMNFPNMTKPCLSCAVDGVGTKLKLASQFSSFKGVGQDLVAMCVNDLLCTGSRPLFFFDYYSAGAINEDHIKEFLEGVMQACEKSGCSLVGGETAEMPGCYQKNDFDCAGFAIGIVDEDERLGAHRVRAGDFILALPSSGFHSNGYSLLRKLFAQDLDQWRGELLKPTALYPELFSKVLKKKAQALAHITGGGMQNILRSCPKGSVVELQNWEVPAPFAEAQRRSGLSWRQFLNIFNTGMGMAVFVRPGDFDELKQKLKEAGVESFLAGKILEMREGQNSKLDYKNWDQL